MGYKVEIISESHYSVVRFGAEEHADAIALAETSRKLGYEAIVTSVSQG